MFFDTDSCVRMLDKAGAIGDACALELGSAERLVAWPRQYALNISVVCCL
jgi:hypothetical protein